MTTQENYLDFYNVFVNIIVGDIWLAIILGLIIIYFASLKFKMPMELSILFSMMWLVAIYSETFIIIIWTFIVLFVGTLFYYTISRVFD